MTNLKVKAGSWKKRPAKLVGMFTGYGCSPLMVEGVLRRAASGALSEIIAQAGGAAGGGASAAVNLGPAQQAILTQDASVTMARLASESDEQLHRLVAHFVATRWPIAMALNKADAPAAASAINACRLRFPHRVLIPTSARAELAAIYASERVGCFLHPASGAARLASLIDSLRHATATSDARSSDVHSSDGGEAMGATAAAPAHHLPAPEAKGSDTASVAALPSPPPAAAAAAAAAAAVAATPAAAGPASIAALVAELTKAQHMVDSWGTTGVLNVLSACVT